MLNFSKKVNLKPVDPDKLKIEKSDEFPEAYAFELELDFTPDDIWEEIFEQERKTSFYPLKSKVTVIGNRLRVVTASNEIEGKIGWVKGLVESTNQRVDAYNEEVKVRNKAEEQERAREQETIKKMREKLRK